ncbi:MAG: glycosyltransferase [Burkholderiaceae bacterium]|jgi:glycosyltransferase involved in cell wall biosynthesis|uniref:glycosyltransferase n=1 Tax=Ottowia thiooxydans TaxID=219182 RepID=UPI00048BDA52|nr:glycosyltransferase [Ottowia thiooxydans]TXH35861.1 MAG: glycosyltransferase [Burkholderiaceae bacterium]
MNMLRVSVVISVQNRSAMLLDCLRGLAAQTLARDQFEVVVIDNCSTQDLSPVIEQARQTWSLQIQTARTSQDRGPAPARNLGVQMAKGAIIAFTDSDCRPVPEWLARGLVAFDDPAVALVSGPVLPKPEQTASFTAKLSFVTVTEHPTFPTANLMVKREAFLAQGGFDISLSFRDPLNRATECADTDLAWRVIKAGHQRRFIPEAVMHHELEEQGLLLWLLEPTRLFLLPELVRRHPELRQSLLTAGLFFYPRGFLLYLSLMLCAAVLLWKPELLWALPIGILLRGLIRTKSLNPLMLLRFCARAPLHVLKLMVMNLALLYGSVRFRSLVL